MALTEMEVTSAAPPGTRAFFGVKNGKPPRWAVELASYVPGIVGITPQSHRFILFLPVGTRTFAICFGYGASALEWSAIEGNFGIRVAARLIAPDAVKEIRARRVSSTARTQSVLLPLGGEIRELEVDLEGEFVRKLVGKLESSGATLAEGSTLVSGDSIAFDEIADLYALQSTLVEMLDSVQKTEQRPEFEFIDALVPIPVSSELAKNLDSVLASTVLGKPKSAEGIFDGAEVHFSEMIPPDDLDMDSVDVIVAEREGRTHSFSWDARPTLTELIRELKVTRGKSFLKEIRISARSSDGNSIGTSQPLQNWIVFEFGGALLRYVLSFGRWFSLNESFAIKLNKDLKKIADSTSILGLPDMTAGEKEGDYNRRVGLARADVIVLDQVDIRPENGSEVEACDLLHSSGHLIHVKKWEGSHDMSHHLAQGAVSAELLTGDSTYREGFLQAVHAIDSNYDKVAQSAPVAVTWALAISSGYDFPLGLPSFSKINLRDAAKRVSRLRAKPYIARINRF